MPVADPNDGPWLVEWEKPAYGLTANTGFSQIPSASKEERRFHDRAEALSFMANLGDRERPTATLKDLRGSSVLHASQLKDEVARLRTGTKGSPS